MLSRIKVFKFEEHTKESLNNLVERILKNKKEYFNYENIDIKKESIERLIIGSNGDARKLIDTLELSIHSTKEKNKKKIISVEKVNELLENNSVYDKKSDNHYNNISAFIKSIRGSDPNAAIYYLARMLKMVKIHYL